MTSHEAHETEAVKQITSPRVAIVTISDTRSTSTDASGDAIASVLRDSFDCAIAARTLIRDEADAIQQTLQELFATPTVDAIITTGGTGVSPRDRTIKVVAAMFQRELPGFGELFRMLSFQQVGAAAMLSRAVGGIGPANKPVFALPGSTAAVTLAARDLIGPQLRHLLAQLRRPAES